MMSLKKRKTETAILVFFLFCALLGPFVSSDQSILRVSEVKADAAWLTGFNYRMNHTLLNATGAGTDYQMNVTLYTESPWNYIETRTRWIWTQSISAPAAIHYGDITFVGWQGNSADLDPYVSEVNHTSGAVSSYFVADNPLTDDPHGAPTLLITDDNYLHVFYGCHQTNLKHAKSNSPLDASAWTVQSDPVASCTYPSAVKLANGTVFIFYRRSEGTEMNWAYIRSNNNCSTFSSSVAMTNVETSTYVYLQINIVPDGERLYCAWTMLNTDGQSERHNLYYGYFNLTDGGMYNVTGSNLGILTQAEMDAYCKVYDSGNEEVSYDSWAHGYSGGNPHVITALEDDSGVWNLTDAYWDGDSWTLENILGYNRTGSYGRPCSFMNGTNSIMLYWVSDPLYLKVIKWNGTAWSLVTTANHNPNSPRYGSGEGLSDPKVVLNGDSSLRIVIGEMYYGNTGTDIWLYGYGDGEGDYGWYLRSDYPDQTADSVTIGGLAEDDWTDIRITGSDGTTLWPIYNITQSDASVTIWFKVPDDLSSSNVLMYVYFGNSTVNSGYTLGDNVFIAWDDFDHGYTAGETPNTTRGWESIDDVTIQNNPSGRSGMGLMFDTAASADYEGAVCNWSTLNPSIAVHFSWHIDGVDLRNGYFNIAEGGVNRLGMMCDSGAFKYYDGDSWELLSPTSTYGGGTWYELEYQVKAAYAHQIKGTSEYTAGLRSALVEGFQACQWSTYSTNTYVFKFYVDEFYTRKWLEDGPEHGSWGALETYSENGGNGENTAPSLDSFSISDTEVARGQVVVFLVTATDIDGVADIASLRLRMHDWSDAPYDSSDRIDFLWEDGSFSESWDPNGWGTLRLVDCLKTDVDADTIQVRYVFSIDDFLRDPAWIDVEVTVYDTAGYGSGTGQNNYFRLYIPGGDPGPAPPPGDGTNGYIPPGSIPPSEGEWPPGTWPPGYIPPGTLPPSQGGPSFWPLTIKAFSNPFRIPQGETRIVMMTVTWSGANTLKILKLDFTGPQAEWSTVEDLPVTMMKEITGEEGEDTFPVTVSVPYNADLGDYTIPATLDAQASELVSLSTAAYLSFEVVEPPAGTIFPLLPDWMTLLLLLVVAVILIYAYMRD